MQRRSAKNLAVTFLFYIAFTAFWIIPAEAQTLNIKTPTGYYPMYKQSRALIIGLAKYNKKSPFPNLNIVPKEIENVKPVLEAQGFQVDIRRDLNASELTSVLKTFLIQQTDHDTRLLVFFAGHGYTDKSDNMGYLVPTDVPKEEDPTFRASLLSMQEIKGWAHQSKAKHVLFVFDSCFSGSVFLTRSLYLKPKSELFIRDIDRRGIQFITSGDAEEEVPDSLEFASAIVDGLSGQADLNQDGIVSANELGYYVRDRIISNNKQTPQYGSDPDAAYRGGDEIFVPASDVVHAARVKLPSVEPPAEAGPRGANLRSIGEPDSEGNSTFTGLEVLYYEKLSDGGLVKKALNAEKIPFVATGAQVPEKFQANTLACEPDVPIEALKQVATALTKGGISIREIRRFSKLKDKPKRIEILSLTKGNAGKEQVLTPALSIEQIEALKECPVRLNNRG